MAGRTGEIKRSDLSFVRPPRARTGTLPQQAGVILDAALRSCCALRRVVEERVGDLQIATAFVPQRYDEITAEGIAGIVGSNDLGQRSSWNIESDGRVEIVGVSLSAEPADG